MGNFAENLNLGNRFRPPLLATEYQNEPPKAYRENSAVYIFAYLCIIRKQEKYLWTNDLGFVCVGNMLSMNFFSLKSFGFGYFLPIIGNRKWSTGLEHTGKWI